MNDTQIIIIGVLLLLSLGFNMFNTYQLQRVRTRLRNNLK